LQFETGKVLPRGERGELHIGGNQVIKAYLLSDGQGEDPQSAFYDDEEGHWLKSGDQAVMAENGEVTVVGRYKDLIFRGGENISPSSIEQLLARDFSLTAEVVAAPGESVCIGAWKVLKLI
jgi:acyl-CoA synthetase (AMP-forming)/AMP-acid ligase II